MMFNDPFVTLLCKEEGLNIMEILDRMNLEDNVNNRGKTQRKLRSLMRYGIVRTNTMFNVYSPKSSKDRRYFLTESARAELGDDVL